MDLEDIFGSTDPTKRKSTRRQPFKKDNADRDDCTICLSKQDATSLVTPCGHEFHHECLDKAYAVTGSCPNCRQVFPDRWLYTNLIVIKMSSREYWRYVEENILPPPPPIGPLLPSQQRHYDVLAGTILNLNYTAGDTKKCNG